MFLGFALSLALTYTEAATVIPPKQEYCGSIQKVANFVTDCGKNKDLAMLGLRCVAKLQRESKRVSSQLANSFSRGDEAQILNFSGHDKNIKSALEKLEGLEKKNDVAIKDILRYMMNLVHPDDLYELPTNADAKSFLLNSSCFGPNRRKLLFALHKMEVNKDGIGKSKKILQGLSGKSNQEIAKLLQMNFVGDEIGLKLNDQQGIPGAKIPVKKGRGKSDISGTEEEDK